MHFKLMSTYRLQTRLRIYFNNMRDVPIYTIHIDTKLCTENECKSPKNERC